MREEMFIRGISISKLEELYFFKNSEDLNLANGDFIKAGTKCTLDSIENDKAHFNFEHTEDNIYKDGIGTYDFSMEELKHYFEPDFDKIKLMSLEYTISTDYYIEKIINMDVSQLKDELKNCLSSYEGVDYPREDKYDYIEKHYGDNSMEKLVVEYIESAKEAKKINEGQFVGINEYIEGLIDLEKYEEKAKEKETPFYGKIDYLGMDGKVVETVLYENRESFRNEIKDSWDIGRPIQSKELTKDEYKNELNRISKEKKFEEKENPQINIVIGESESEHFKKGDSLTTDKADEMFKKYDIKNPDRTYDKVKFSILIDNNFTYEGTYYLGEGVNGLVKNLENNYESIRTMNEQGTGTKEDIKNLNLLQDKIIPQVKNSMRIPLKERMAVAKEKSLATNNSNEKNNNINKVKNDLER